MKPKRPNLQELCYLYEGLSLEERDDLLQSLLVAAVDGGKAMLSVLEELLLRHSVEELLREYAT